MLTGVLSWAIFVNPFQSAGQHDAERGALAIAATREGDAESSTSWLQFAARRALHAKLPAVQASDERGAAKREAGSGRLYFLFMLRDSLPHLNVWQAFFARAPRGSWRAFAHCTSHSDCSKSAGLAKLGVEVVATVASKWCVDLVSPEVQLLRAALSADAADGLSGPRKFVLLSDSTLPIQPLSRIQRVLLKTEHSDLCISPENEWASASIFGVTYSVVKHHQWAVLSHADAEAFVRGWEKLSSYHLYASGGKLTLRPGQYEWLVPRMGADGRANFSETIPRMTLGASGRCPDEEVLTSLLFGMYEPSRSDVWQRIFSQTVCRTYVNWRVSHPPEVFSNVTDKLRALSQDSSDSAYLFARKFKPSASVKELKSILARASPAQ